jgi:hypothetical protein
VMALEIIDCEQGSEEWFRARMGIPTASQFKTVMAEGRSGNESKTRRKYLFQLVGEIITDTPMENYNNDDMLRGKEHEPLARADYAYIHDDLEVQRVGFIRNGNKGCSPDGLIGNDGMVELKSSYPHIILEAEFEDRVPSEHLRQCYGNLWIAEREWIDLMIFWPKMPEQFCKRIYRNEAEIKRIAGAVADFNGERLELLERARRRYA